VPVVCYWHAAILSGLNLKISITATFLAGVLLHGAATSASFDEAKRLQSPLDITLSVKKIVYVRGEERRLDATHAQPGDTLEYRAEYKNTGATTLSALSATLPLPEHTIFVTGSAYPAGAEASTRSAKDTFVPLSSKENTDEKAAAKSGAASDNMYGTLRWTIEKLTPGQIAAVGVRVRVDSMASKKIPDTPLTVQAGPLILQ
jgi:uncharacterized repeat protein (TIGR01451 family)